MNPSEQYPLLFGPYKTPAFEYGQTMHCERRGDLIVCGLSNRRIPWPIGRPQNGGPSLILCGDLARAVKQEAALVIQHWWGVGRCTVWEWRKTLGVEFINEGTHN